MNMPDNMNMGMNMMNMPNIMNANMMHMMNMPDNTNSNPTNPQDDDDDEDIRKVDPRQWRNPMLAQMNLRNESSNSTNGQDGRGRAGVGSAADVESSSGQNKPMTGALARFANKKRG